MVNNMQYFVVPRVNIPKAAIGPKLIQGSSWASDELLDKVQNKLAAEGPRHQLDMVDLQIKDTKIYIQEICGWFTLHSIVIARFSPEAL